MGQKQIPIAADLIAWLVLMVSSALLVATARAFLVFWASALRRLVMMACKTAAKLGKIAGQFVPLVVRPGFRVLSRKIARAKNAKGQQEIPFVAKRRVSMAFGTVTSPITIVADPANTNALRYTLVSLMPIVVVDFAIP
jgi:hypothetical protein